MHVSGNKYEAVSTDNGYNKYMLLKIRNVGPDDFGSYKCVAKNSLGETDGVIKLDGESHVVVVAVFFSRRVRFKVQAVTASFSATGESICTSRPCSRCAGVPRPS